MKDNVSIMSPKKVLNETYSEAGDYYKFPVLEKWDGTCVKFTILKSSQGYTYI